MEEGEFTLPLVEFDVFRVVVDSKTRHSSSANRTVILLVGSFILACPVTTFQPYRPNI